DEDALRFERIQVRDAVGGLTHYLTSARAVSSRGARSFRHTTRSGRSGSGRLYASGVPSIRLACRPVASATAAGAAESHSYCPPACTYASASPAITAAILAPAEPIGTRSAPRRSASPARNAGGRDRLAARRSRPPEAASGDIGGDVGGKSVARTRCCAGNATAAAARWDGAVE